MDRIELLLDIIASVNVSGFIIGCMIHYKLSQIFDKLKKKNVIISVD